MTDGLVHLIDDDAAMRDSVTFLLETADLRVKSYESAVAFLQQAAELEPGCIVTDVRMPEVSGLELIERLKDMGLNHPVIVITGHADVPLAIQAMKAGVLDFIEKPFDDEVLISAIRTALAQGKAIVQREVEMSAIRARLDALSNRERDVLQGLVAGHPNKIIAYNLGISARTVEIYRANVMTKMAAGSLSELVRMSLAAGV